MHDDDSRGLESPARADASPPTADGSRAWIELTGFQRDCLEAIARRERDDKPCNNQGIVWTLERRYPRVSRNRVDPNLSMLVGHGLLETTERSTEPTRYGLTDAGRALLVQRVERLADACGISAIDGT
ncbi:PadR family transcriptional regulator [Natrinema sp. SYSU A 869]|uniref:PadR family transcriptional regulator n=1 Tax=Natrinema sp. SYSU A 869 TaxID=2871694 RepID=UPI001CA46607|nr:PadR family transcriptional regulator [Natrinema sp. SYSU A 869]